MRIHLFLNLSSRSEFCILHCLFRFWKEGFQYTNLRYACKCKPPQEKTAGDLQDQHQALLRCHPETKKNVNVRDILCLCLDVIFCFPLTDLCRRSWLRGHGMLGRPEQVNLTFWHFHYFFYQFWFKSLPNWTSAGPKNWSLWNCPSGRSGKMFGGCIFRCFSNLEWLYEEFEKKAVKGHKYALTRVK